MTIGEGRIAFPDSVTTRGTKHLLELERLAAAGERAVLLFCVNRDDARTVEAASEIDPVYAETLRRVHRRGVEVMAYGARVESDGVFLGASVPVLNLG